MGGEDQPNMLSAITDSLFWISPKFPLVPRHLWGYLGEPPVWPVAVPVALTWGVISNGLRNRQGSQPLSAQWLRWENRGCYVWTVFPRSTSPTFKFLRMRRNWHIEFCSVFLRDNLVKMWSQGWALIQYNWCPHKRKLGTEIDRETTQEDTKGRQPSTGLGEARVGSPSQHHKSQPSQHLISGFQPPEL